ncbi:LOG family protein, partial [Candidatus Parcubacteria bacterium]|nr:LOG family protein [Candidatus Parcubacteria bacterium]
VVGTWRKHKAAPFKKEAEELGRLLAAGGHILITGGGTGISEIVVNSYKSNNGKKYIAYLPSLKCMRELGEKIGSKPDKIVKTGLDYPMRNALMVKNCDGIVVFHGGLGTLAEITHAVKDYNKKVSVIDKGDLAKWVKAIPKLKNNVLLTADIKKALQNLEKQFLK